jgi:hypothetical protein
MNHLLFVTYYETSNQTHNLEPTKNGKYYVGIVPTAEMNRNILRETAMRWEKEGNATFESSSKEDDELEGVPGTGYLGSGRLTKMMQVVTGHRGRNCRLVPQHRLPAKGERPLWD